MVSRDTLAAVDADGAGAGSLPLSINCYVIGWDRRIQEARAGAYGEASSSHVRSAATGILGETEFVEHRMVCPDRRARTHEGGLLRSKYRLAVVTYGHTARAG